MTNGMAALGLSVGEKLPPMSVLMTAQKIISAAAATRDWQPIHHDHEMALKSGLRDIILNSPSQAGWISKYITDRVGSQASIKRMAFKMKDAICPGDEMQIQGEVIARENAVVTVSVTISVGDKLKTSAEVRLALPV
jgi:acyl dehydratase